MNYIGIRGHKGAGKKTIAYLLGNTIEYITKHNKGEDTLPYNNQFTSWCDNIITDENIVQDISLDDIYFDSFGDTPKLLAELLLGCDQKYLYNDYYKDHVVVNMRDFSCKVYDELPDNIKLYDADEMYMNFSQKKNPTPITKDLYITLREFIMYFGREVMQRFFGLNVWVKSLVASSERFTSIFNDENAYKIFMDIKFPSEVTYIKDHNGIIINVTRPGHRKRGSDKLSQDIRIDYEVVIGKNLYDLSEIIYNIAEEIIKNNTDKNGEENN